MSLMTLEGRQHAAIARYSLSEYLRQRVQAVESMWFPGFSTAATVGGRPVEQVENSYTGYVNGAYKTNTVVAACMRVRRDIFRQARFCWRETNDTGPGRCFRDDALTLLERPWPNGSTGELLTRMITDIDLCGNSYVLNEGTRLRWLRPDWVSIVLSADPAIADRVDVVGYVYVPGGGNLEDGTVYTPDEICHWAPNQDPMAQYRGMSWLTPAIREIQADQAATEHKLMFFTNGATLGPIVRVPAGVTPEQFREFVATADAAHVGSSNAYRPFYIGGGVDVTLAGASMQQLEFKATQGAGEPLALDTPVPTPTGWTTMGEIEPGDRVFGRDGRPAVVLAVSPTYEGHVCYRITLKDRTSFVADAAHRWAAVDRNTKARAERVYTTQELYDLFVKPFPNGVGGHRLSLPASPMLDLPEVDLLVDPYILGAWLGDGQTTGAAICGADEDLVVIATEIKSRGYTVTQWKTGDKAASVIGLPGGLLAALRALDVLGDKHIPEIYLRASVDQRLDLLRGLMDTDGTIDHRSKGVCEYSSKDGHLARQVADLVRSLGYRATVSSKVESRSRTGLTWRVFFRVEMDRIPFLLPRKIDRCLTAGRPHVRSRSIVSIEPIDSVPVRCITVDTADHLFLVGDGFVPTHNSRIAALAGTHPVLVGFSEGLSGSSLNAGNYAAARRSVADVTMWPLWQDVCDQLASFVDNPPDAELWIRERQIPFLREDAKDQAEITRVRMSMLESGIRAGYKPDALVELSQTDDFGVLYGQHSNMFSVQLQPAGGTAPAAVEPAPLDLTRPIQAEATVNRAITAYADDDELDRAGYRPGQPRHGKGVYIGRIPVAGRWRKLTGGLGGIRKVIEALDAWARGEGPDEPLAGFPVAKLRRAARDMGLPAHGGRGEVEGRILDDVRKKVRGHRQRLRDLPQYSYGTGVDRPRAKDRDGTLRDIEITQTPSGLVVRLLDENNRGMYNVAAVKDWAALYRWARERKLKSLAGWVDKYHPTTALAQRRRRLRNQRLLSTLRGYPTFVEAEYLLHGLEPAEVADLYRHLGGDLAVLPKAPDGRVPTKAVIDAVLTGWPQFRNVGTIGPGGAPLAVSSTGSVEEPDIDWSMGDVQAAFGFDSQAVLDAGFDDDRP